MNAENAMRFVAREAEWCRDRDQHEALCLLLPAMMRALGLQPMTDAEVEAFRREFKVLLKQDFRFDPAPSKVAGGEDVERET